MAPPLVIITDTDLGDGSLERAVLEGEFTFEHFNVHTEDEVLAIAGQAEGLLVQWAPITDRVLAGLPRLRAIVRYGIGIENIDLDAARRRGVAVSNVSDYCLSEVADHAAAFIYAHNRRLEAGSRSITHNGWGTAHISPPLPPANDPVGIAGYGHIGSKVADRLAGLDFPIHIWDPFVTSSPTWVTPHGTLAGLARAVNHLTLHMPSTPETVCMVDAPVLRALGPHGHLVNTARGALIDESALLTALNLHELGFASLDVLATEPPVGQSTVLAGHPQVLLTPHIAYLSTDSLPALQVRAAEILRELLRKAA